MSKTYDSLYHRRGEATREKVFQAIRTFWQEHGYSPSVRNIAQAVNRSTSATQHHIKVLVEEGRIKQDVGVTRSIRIVNNEHPIKT